MSKVSIWDTKSQKVIDAICECFDVDKDQILGFKVESDGKSFLLIGEFKMYPKVVKE